jgi:hypothetical protein
MIPYNEESDEEGKTAREEKLDDGNENTVQDTLEDSPS